MAVVECTLSAKNIREAETFDKGRIVCAVNSFTSDKMRPYFVCEKRENMEWMFVREVNKMERFEVEYGLETYG